MADHHAYQRTYRGVFSTKKSGTKLVHKHIKWQSSNFNKIAQIEVLGHFQKYAKLVSMILHMTIGKKMVDILNYIICGTTGHFFTFFSVFLSKSTSGVHWVNLL